MGRKTLHKEHKNMFAHETSWSLSHAYVLLVTLFMYEQTFTTRFQLL